MKNNFRIHRATFAAALQCLAFCLLLLVFSQSAVGQEPSSTVGYPGLIKQQVIDGPELVAKPIEDRDQPLVVRILETYPHGSSFRYDIEYIGLEPGMHNLGDFLQPADGSVENWTPPEIQVHIGAILPPGQVEPSGLEIPNNRFSSYYLAMLVVGGVLWLAGLFAILFYGRGRFFRPEYKAKAVTVADRLKPLIQQAADGELNAAGQAELERVLVAFWSKKLRLGHLSADELRSKLREHPEAGQTLRLIDRWLHAPPENEEFNIAELIEPYQSLNMDEV